MRNWRGCTTVVGIGSLLFGLLLLLAVVFGFDPTGVSGQLGLNLFVLIIFLIGFWGIGIGLLYLANRSR